MAPPNYEYHIIEAFRHSKKELNKLLVWHFPKRRCDDGKVVFMKVESRLRTIIGSIAESKLVAAGEAASITPATLSVRPED